MSTQASIKCITGHSTITLCACINICVQLVLHSHSSTHVFLVDFLYSLFNSSQVLYYHRGHDRMVVGFSTTYAISAYHPTRLIKRQELFSIICLYNFLFSSYPTDMEYIFFCRKTTIPIII